MDRHWSGQPTVLSVCARSWVGPLASVIATRHVLGGFSAHLATGPATAVLASSPPPPPGPPAARPRHRHARCLPPRHGRARPPLPGAAPLTAPLHDPARCRRASSIITAWDGTGTVADACSVPDLPRGALLPARRSLVAAAASLTRVALPRGCEVAQSRLRCGFLSRPSVYVDDADGSMIVLPSSSFGIAVAPADVRRVSDDEDEGQDADGALGLDFVGGAGGMGEVGDHASQRDGGHVGGLGGGRDGPRDNDGGDQDGTGADVDDARLSLGNGDQCGEADCAALARPAAGVAPPVAAGVAPAVADGAAAGNDIIAGASSMHDGETSADGSQVGGFSAALCRRACSRVPRPPLALCAPETPRRRVPSTTTTDGLPFEEEVLLDFYTKELQVAVGMTARMGGAAAVTGACLHGAQVLIVLEAYDPIVTWTTYTDGILLSLCSCSGVPGGGRSSFTGLAMEYATTQAALERSCPCRHATALLRAYESLAHRAGSFTLAELFKTFPTLLGPIDREGSDSAPVSTITYDVKGRQAPKRAHLRGVLRRHVDGRGHPPIKQQVQARNLLPIVVQVTPLGLYPCQSGE